MEPVKTNIVIKSPFDANAEIEKRAMTQFGDKERQRSNHASGLADIAQGTRRRCPSFPVHDKIAWSGPPHDAIRAYVCLYCSAAACEPEIKDRGYAFDEVPEDVLIEILDLDLQRQATMNPRSFGGLGGLVLP